MLAILNSLNAHNLLIFQPILMIFVSKFKVHRALSDKTYLSLRLLSPSRRMDLPSRISRTSPFPILGVFGGIFHSYSKF